MLKEIESEKKQIQNDLFWEHQNIQSRSKVVININKDENWHHCLNQENIIWKFSLPNWFNERELIRIPTKPKQKRSCENGSSQSRKKFLKQPIQKFCPPDLRFNVQNRDAGEQELAKLNVKAYKFRLGQTAEVIAKLKVKDIADRDDG